jgi:hypothetical protein
MIAGRECYEKRIIEIEMGESEIYGILTNPAAILIRIELISDRLP